MLSFGLAGCGGDTAQPALPNALPPSPIGPTPPTVLSEPTGLDPFPTPIPETEGVITVGIAEFAVLPESSGRPARMNLLSWEPGTGRLFVNDMRGPLYTLDRNGGAPTLYLDLSEERWSTRAGRALALDASSGEKGFSSFAFHPWFATRGAPGYGRFYTWADSWNTRPPADFAARESRRVHDTVLLEWTAADPAADSYDGGPPRELMRFAQPYSNHNGGLIAFNPLAAPEDSDFGLLYLGSGDGGSGGDPLRLAQDPTRLFGKILRIAPLAGDSQNGAYGIPGGNPFAGAREPRPEIYASGLRNPQRFGWDPATGRLFVADIGQNVIEEISVVAPGADLGWSLCEGSFRYVHATGQVQPDAPCREAGDFTDPFVEYDHQDALFHGGRAITGVVIVRGGAIPELRDRLLFGDFPSGEVFWTDADGLGGGGQAAVRRVLFRARDRTATLLDWIQETAVADGRAPPSRADLRFGTGPEGAIFLLNKHDGVIRRLVGR